MIAAVSDWLFLFQARKRLNAFFHSQSLGSNRCLLAGTSFVSSSGKVAVALSVWSNGYGIKAQCCGRSGREIEFRLSVRRTGEIFGRRSQLTRRADQRIYRMALPTPVAVVDPIPFIVAPQQPCANELRYRPAEVALAGNACSRSGGLFDEGLTLRLIDGKFAALLQVSAYAL